MQNTDIYVFSEANLLEQAQQAEEKLGYKILRFYIDERGLLAKQPTDNTSTFYLSPSGGTLRDSNMNLVLYSARYDKYKGYGKA